MAEGSNNSNGGSGECRCSDLASVHVSVSFLLKPAAPESDAQKLRVAHLDAATANFTPAPPSWPYGTVFWALSSI